VDGREKNRPGTGKLAKGGKCEPWTDPGRGAERRVRERLPSVGELERIERMRVRVWIERAGERSGGAV